MLYTIIVASHEAEDFDAELQIESQATFYDLHQLVRRACGWGKGAPATFFICDHRWRHERTIPESSYELDVMADIELGDYLEDEGQRLQYLFDPQEGRVLLLEVRSIAFSKHIDSPTIVRSHGQAPALELLQAEPPAPKTATPTNDDLLAQLTAAALAIDADDEGTDIVDDSDFDPEEIDPEGFDINEF